MEEKNTAELEKLWFHADSRSQMRLGLSTELSLLPEEHRLEPQVYRHQIPSF